MADQALQNALVKRDTLARQINEAQQYVEGLRRDLTRVDAFIADWHKYAGVPAPEQTSYAIETSGPPPSTKKVLNNSKKEEVAAATVELITAAGRPMSRNELFPALTQKKGMRIEGTDPDMVLSTMLWRMMKKAGLVRLKGGGYWLRDKPYPEAGYDPSQYSWMDSALNTPSNEITEPDAAESEE